MIHSSKHIFTVSNFSKSEIVNYYKINPEKISIIYNAVEKKFQRLERKKSENYILSLSNINKQKNLISLIKAFNRLDRSDIKLYIIGSSHKNFNNYELHGESINNKNIRFLGGDLSDSEVIQYYSDAMFFASLSLYEGFGIPPLEAQACGTPVLLSNIPVFKEVYGDSAIYCGSTDIDDIFKKLSLLIDNKNLRDDMSKRGFTNLNKYSWSNSAKNILNTINYLDDK
jgi:glycosyltransferase involved in cell wall biosynthesis